MGQDGSIGIIGFCGSGWRREERGDEGGIGGGAKQSWRVLKGLIGKMQRVPDHRSGNGLGGLAFVLGGLLLRIYDIQAMT